MDFTASFGILCFLSGYTVDGHFGYSKRNQHIWIKDYKDCAGKWQSPVALSSGRAVALPLPALETIGYHDLLQGPLILKNNGHSVALSLDKEGSTKRPPYIFGALLNPGEEYELEGLHFHWGRKNYKGSEHVLNGIRFPMEMHLVHRNTKYSDFQEAIRHEDGLAVLAVFFQLQEEDNDSIRPLLSSFPDVQWLDSRTRMNATLPLASLLPKNLDTYYTYRGSLTTPPCSETVTWIIFPTTVPISFKQINKFRKLSNGEDILADNYRLLQDIGNRKVYVRRLSTFPNNYNEIVNVDIASLRWYWQ